MNTRKLWIVAVIVAVVLGTVALPVWSSGQSEEGTQEPIKIRATHVNAADHPVGIGLERFKELVEDRSGGNITVSVFHNAALGSAREIVEGVQVNTIQVGSATCGIMESFSPVHDIFSLPFLFRDIDHFKKVMEGPLYDEMAAGLEKIDLHLFGYSTSGYRQIYANKPINSVEDLKGLKLRVMSVDTIVDTIEALGAQPVPIGFGEVYTALQTGTVDGAESSIISWYRSNHYEVANHIAMVNYMDSGRVYFASKAFMDGLSKDQKELIDKAMKDAISNVNDLYTQQQEEIEKTVVPTLDDAYATYPDLGPFYKVAEQIYANNPPTLGSEWIDLIRNTE